MIFFLYASHPLKTEPLGAKRVAASIHSTYDNNMYYLDLHLAEDAHLNLEVKLTQSKIKTLHKFR